MLHRRTRTFARFLPATVGSLALLAVTGVAAPVATTGTGAPPPSAGRTERTGTLVEAHGDDLTAGVEHGHAWVLRLDDGTMIDLDNAPDHTAHGLVGRKVKVAGHSDEVLAALAGSRCARSAATSGIRAAWRP